MLLFVFLISIAVLLLCIIKIKLNAFVALLVCAYGTGLLALATYAGGGAPENFASIADVTACVTSNFGSTLGSIGIVTGLGVMLGMFMYESGGIDNIVDKVLKAVGSKRSQYAVSVAGFITGIPVFGDVVYIMFAPCSGCSPAKPATPWPPMAAPFRWPPPAPLPWSCLPRLRWRWPRLWISTWASSSFTR